MLKDGEVANDKWEKHTEQPKHENTTVEKAQPLVYYNITLYSSENSSNYDVIIIHPQPPPFMDWFLCLLYRARCWENHIYHLITMKNK